MKRFAVSVRVDEITIARHPRSGHENVIDRVMVQLVCPEKVNVHVTQTFAFKAVHGRKLTAKEMVDVLPDGILIKNQGFVQSFGEPIRLNIHLFQDTPRAGFEKFLGNFVKLSLSRLLEEATLGGIALEKIIAPADGLKLDDKSYAIKTGYRSLALDPERQQGIRSHSVTLKAPTTVKHFIFRRDGSSREPRHELIFKKNSVSANLRISVSVEPK